MAATAQSTSESVVPVDVFTGQDFYVPSFKIWKNSTELKGIVSDVLSVSYTDSLTAIDSFDLVVNNWDPDKATLDNANFRTSPFKYSDTNMFDPWQSVELYMGYIHNGIDERQKMLTGEITTMTPSFPASGGSTLTVRALNLLHRFRTKQKTRPFINRQDSEIAEMLVADIASDIRKAIPNLTLQLDKAEIDANKKSPNEKNKIPYLVMQNQYPINFLLQRSRDIGYELFLTEPQDSGQSGKRVVTLHYHPTAASKQVSYILEWGKSLISFQPTLQTANQVSSVTVRGWDPAGKTKIESTVQRSAVQGVVQPGDLQLSETGLSQKLEIMVDKPIQSKAEAEVVARQTMLRLAQGIVEAKGKTVGLPNLRAGSKIVVKGLGTRFSGTYLVTTTTHTIGEGGYTTDFSARMEAKTTSPAG
jgi:phage protein D